MTTDWSGRPGRRLGVAPTVTLIACAVARRLRCLSRLAGRPNPRAAVGSGEGTTVIKWLYPGMHVKRWLLLLAAGVIGFSLAIAMGLAWAYRNIDFPAPVTDLVQTLTLQFIPHPYREIGWFGRRVAEVHTMWILGD